MKSNGLPTFAEIWKAEDLHEVKIRLEIEYVLHDFYEACTNGKLMTEEDADTLGLTDWAGDILYRINEIGEFYD